MTNNKLLEKQKKMLAEKIRCQERLRDRPKMKSLENIDVALEKFKMERRRSDIPRDRWVSLLRARLAGRPGKIMTHLDVHDEGPFDNVIHKLLSQAGVNPCLAWEQIPDFNDFARKTPEALCHTIRQKLVRMHTSKLSVPEFLQPIIVKSLLENNARKYVDLAKVHNHDLEGFISTLNDFYLTSNRLVERSKFPVKAASTQATEDTHLVSTKLLMLIYIYLPRR